MVTETWSARTETAPAAGAPTFSRLLPPHPKRSFAEHLEWFGDLPRADAGLIGEVERAGLRGKGGARFPTATKLAAVASRGRAIVVANGTEGEPASMKDLVLMSQAPHLALDGAVVAAEMVGATEVILCVKRGSALLPLLDRALAERHAQSYDSVPIRVVGAPNRYVSGEETAVVSWLNGRDAKPAFVPPRPFERGVAGRPTLVQNVETLSDLALIGRFGADWYRAAGTPDEPGTTLVTLSGAVQKPGVCEVPLGARLGDVLRVAGTDCKDLSGVLVGGYFGAWVPAATAVDLPLSVEGLRRGRRWSRRGHRRRDAPRRRMCARRGHTCDAMARRPERRPVRRVRERAGGDRRRDGGARRRRSQQTRREGPFAVGDDDGGARRVQAPGRRRPLRREQLEGVLRGDRAAPAPRPVPRERSADPSHAEDGRLAMSFRLVLNPITCVGHGMCAELFPERITLDDWGYPIIDKKPIPPGLEAHAAPSSCRVPDARAPHGAGGAGALVSCGGLG